MTDHSCSTSPTRDRAESTLPLHSHSNPCPQTKIKNLSPPLADYPRMRPVLKLRPRDIFTNLSATYLFDPCSGSLVQYPALFCPVHHQIHLKKKPLTSFAILNYMRNITTVYVIFGLSSVKNGAFFFSMKFIFPADFKGPTTCGRRSSRSRPYLCTDPTGY